MNFVSLSELLAAVSDRADLPTLSTSTFITKAQMTRWLNQSGRRLAGKLVATYGAGHFETTQDVNTVAGQDYTNFPSSGSTAETDVFQMLFARVTLDGARVRLHQASESEIDWQDPSDTAGWTVGRKPAWEFREYADQRLLWSVTPQAVHAVTVHYVPYFVFVERSDGWLTRASMSDDDDHGIRGHLGWDEWVILDCAAKALKRQDLTEPALLLEAERNEIEADWKPLARRVQQPKRIQRIYLSDKLGDRWPVG